MIATAHQPHFLPWLGYLNKAVRSDVFIWLDTVQYRKNYFQNRTRVAGVDGVERWLTLPVHARHDTPISAVTIADARWRDRVRRTVEQTYRKAPYFGDCWESLHAAMLASSDLLNDANLRLFQAVLELLAITRVRVVLASSLNVSDIEPTDRLVSLCRAVGARAYIAGKGGRQYLREDAFSTAGISVAWQAFDVARTAYERTGGVPAVGLSIIDCLFHAGPERARAFVERGWAP